MEIFDLIIIGAGPAGITASVYAARKRMNFLVISRDIGGQAGWSGNIENYTGYQFITGLELTAKFQEHMQRYSVLVKENEDVLEVVNKDGVIFVRTNKAGYEAKTAIIASGKRSKELGVPGEKEYKNRGLTYCATCDGPLFSDKDVAVVGGGNSALDAVLQLVRIARHIYIINNTAELTGDKIMQERVRGSSKVSIINNAQVRAVVGGKMVSGIRVVESGGKEELLAVQGVFVEIGLVSSSEFARGVDKNERGEIKVDCYNRTSSPGIFAAGDVSNVPEKQIIIAAGEGAKAAIGAFKYLMRQRS